MDHGEHVEENIRGMSADEELHERSRDWICASARYNYSYNFSWLGRPIIQYPQDIVAMQELIWTIKPDVILETGIAHGGSLIFSASMLELNALCGGPQDSVVVGVDIDIRAHNRAAIEGHPMCRRIEMLKGCAVAPQIVAQIKERIRGRQRVLVFLDSNHTHEHVLAELESYASLVSVGSYCVVFDTIIDAMPNEMFPNRPWGPGNNPRTAVRTFLDNHPEFESDQRINSKLLISTAPDGYLRRLR